MDLQRCGGQAAAPAARKEGGTCRHAGPRSAGRAAGLRGQRHTAFGIYNG